MGSQQRMSNNSNGIVPNADDLQQANAGAVSTAINHPEGDSLLVPSIALQIPPIVMSPNAKAAATAALSPQNRRIIKAKHPQPNTGSTESSNNNTVHSIDKDDIVLNDKHEGQSLSERVYHTYHESMDVIREKEQEKIQRQLTERIEYQEAQRSTKRNTLLQQRRHQSSPKQSSSSSSSYFTANPMSRFFSVFSVDASHPKRAYQEEKHTHTKYTQKPQVDKNHHTVFNTTDADDDAAMNLAPVEKRPRTEPDQSDGIIDKKYIHSDLNPNENDNHSSYHPCIFVCSALLVGVVAIVWSVWSSSRATQTFGRRN